MFRHTAAAALLCSTALATVASPGIVAPDTPAFKLASSGIAGSGNQVAKGPEEDVMAGDMVLAFQKASLKDVVAKFGGTIQLAEENGVAWACYLSPETEPVTIWFTSTFTNDDTMPLAAVALELTAPPETAGCTTLAEPLFVTTGAPGLGATMENLDAAFGPKPNIEDDGTIAYFFGSENLPDGINALTKERKYHMVDGKAVAISAGIFFELQ